MPELPEVETVARLIRPRIAGREVKAVRVRWRASLGADTPAAFGRAVRGARLAAVWRRAKYLVLDLERGGQQAGWLVGHLRMTGRLSCDRERPDPYERLRLELDDGRALRFSDVRKFGRLVFTRDLEAILSRLGPEPLGKEFTPEWLHRALRSRRRMLKPLLLDQTFLAGLGNIYADESLFRARLHPQRLSDSLTLRSALRLHDEIRATLSEAIRHEGSSFDAFYRTPEGRPGRYQDQFQVYGRAGRPCRRCGRRLVRIVVGQRGTHLCRRCQPAPRVRGSAR